MKSRLIHTLIAVAGLTAASAVPAQNYPNKPIRIIVVSTPGGSVDTMARAVGPKLAARWGQQVLVDNRPGAGGALGAELAAKAPADGYTIWLGQTNNLVIGPILRAKNAYDPVRDYAPITLLMKAPQVMVVNVDSSLASIRDLIAAAKKAPGTLTYGSAGIGSSGHINGELFNQSAGVAINHIPYKGGAPAMIDLRGGRITYVATSLASAAQGLKEGKLKALATTGRTRARMLPDVPTVAESGVPGYELTSWHGMLAPTGVPKEAVSRLNRELVAVLRQPNVEKTLLTEGGDITPSTPEEFSTFLRAEIAKWTKVIKQAGITAE